MLVVAIVLGSYWVYRTWLYHKEPSPATVPPSSTLPRDANAELGCYRWRHALDPPLHTKEELRARLDEALDYAQESSVSEVAATARALQRAQEDSVSQAEYDAAADAFEGACSAIGE